MRTIRFKRWASSPFAISMPVVLGLVLGAGGLPVCRAQQAGQKQFSSAREASHALFMAIQDHDAEALDSILGKQSELVSSHDDTQDQRDREKFVQKYRQMHRLVREPDGTATLYIGAENWPFPIPLRSTQAGWYFDTNAGQQELLCRCIGENETKAIQACHTFARSSQRPTQNAAAPIHGYYYRFVAVRTGGSANSKTGREAVIAYPAEYRVSGVMTFLMDPQGKVYEKDLGPNTADHVKARKVLQPDSTWHVVK